MSSKYHCWLKGFTTWHYFIGRNFAGRELPCQSMHNEGKLGKGFYFPCEFGHFSVFSKIDFKYDFADTKLSADRLKT